MAEADAEFCSDVMEVKTCHDGFALRWRLPQGMSHTERC